MPLLAILLYGVVGGILGVIAHLTVFIHGEWHVRAPEILTFHLLPLVVLSVVRTINDDVQHVALLDGLLFSIYCYILALLTSIITYRLFFHRLTKAGFPGPWHLRVSKLCHVWQVRTSKNYMILEDLRQRYGDFVRTGKLRRISTRAMLQAGF
jgi:hypothetical protein